MTALLAESLKSPTTSVTNNDLQRAELVVPVGPEDHSQGAVGTAAITVVQYGDYECRACGAIYPLIKSLSKRRAGDLKLVFRNMPLTQLHPNAQWAAEAAEAASAQGKFWELHDALYEHQTALSPRFIATMARRLGVDLVRFDEDMRSHRFEDRVSRDLAGAVRSGVTSTPAFFINGIRSRGRLDERALTQALDAAAASTRRT